MLFASPPSLRASPSSLRASGTLPSEAIQCEGLSRLDCFAALRLAMTILFSSLRASPSSLRAKRSNPCALRAN
ncbi:MAG: hypothetical protein LBT00_14920 [Spirochaetaceae bacterium]|nr:hypothetical protein [Spirochaetaceae bacterium]